MRACPPKNVIDVGLTDRSLCSGSRAAPTGRRKSRLAKAQTAKTPSAVGPRSVPQCGHLVPELLGQLSWSQLGKGLIPLPFPDHLEELTPPRAMPESDQPIERKLAAIFAADVAGYSRLMGQDEVGTLRRLAAHREIMDRLIATHRGRIANTAGDSVLAEFPSAVDAVKCAVEVQQAIGRLDESDPEDQQLRFRIGVHVGDVVVQGSDLLGDAINIASRLQSLADPGAVCLSGPTHEYVRRSLPLSFDDLGLQNVRNIDEPIRVYAIRWEVRPQSSVPHRLTGGQPSPPTDRPSIAVLPFATTTVEDEYLGAGISDDVITALSKMRWLFVLCLQRSCPRHRTDRPSTWSRLRLDRKRSPQWRESADFGAAR